MGIVTFTGSVSRFEERSIGIGAGAVPDLSSELAPFAMPVFQGTDIMSVCLLSIDSVAESEAYNSVICAFRP